MLRLAGLFLILCAAGPVFAGPLLHDAASDPAPIPAMPQAITVEAAPLPVFPMADEDESDWLTAQSLEPMVNRDRLRRVRLYLDERGHRIDLSVTDMHHNVSVFTRPYRSVFRELRVALLNGSALMPVLSLYRPASDTCLVGLNAAPEQWRRLTDKLNHFERDENLLPLQEIAAAHEIGHCMAARFAEGDNRRWGIHQRELFADVFALMHIREQFPDDEDARVQAFSQMLRFRIGGPRDDTRPSTAQIAHMFMRLEREWPWRYGNGDVLAEKAERIIELMDTVRTPAMQQVADEEP